MPKKFQHTATRRWLAKRKNYVKFLCVFQHTATRRWLVPYNLIVGLYHSVSTHSHPKVAGFSFKCLNFLIIVSTHSHPKVAGCNGDCNGYGNGVSTHSHPKVAGFVSGCSKRG